MQKTAFNSAKHLAVINSTKKKHRTSSATWIMKQCFKKPFLSDFHRFPHLHYPSSKDICVFCWINYRKLPCPGNVTIYLLDDTETFLNWKLLISLYIDSLIHQDAVQYIIIPQGFYKCRQILKRVLRGDRGHYNLTGRVVLFTPRDSSCQLWPKEKGKLPERLPASIFYRNGLLLDKL